MVSKQVQAELDKVLPDDFPALGPVEEVHSGLSNSPLGTVISGASLGLFAAILLGGILFLPGGGPQGYTVQNIVLGIPCVGCALGCVAAVALGLRGFGRRFNYGKHWLGCEGGLIAVFQGKPKAYRWDQVFVWLDVIVSPNRIGVLIDHSYTLRAGKKRQEVLMPAKGQGRMAKRFARALQARQVEMLLPGFFARVDAGEPTPMGLFLFTQGGFAVGGQNWLWDEVKKFNFQYDLDNACIQLTITGRGRHTQKLELSSEMPNL